MSLDRIPGDDSLHIGGLFSLRRKDALSNANITHVVSVLQLQNEGELFTPFQHLMIAVDDVDDENLVEHFATTNSFIQAGLDAGGGVLVHCAMGKSRSATVCIAYMLHKYRHHTPESALAVIREVRPFVEPNEGFMKQLDLYHRMGCPENVDDHPMYQRWLYQQQVEESLACGRAPENVRFEDEVQAPEQQAGDHSSDEVDVKCRKCRRTLANSTFIIPHLPKTTKPTLHQDQQHPSHISEPEQSQQQSQPCAHLFLTPLSWMRPTLSAGELSGRLECPKCNANVGKYAWQGLKCSCGEWVTPGFMVGRAKVDEVRKKGSAGGGVGADMIGIRRPPGVGHAATVTGNRKTEESL